MRVHLRANAKLTTSLRITGVRPDGFHDLDSEMVSLDLADEMEISDGSGLKVSGPFARGVPTDETNLVARALKLLGREAAVSIVKNIPVGAGLGGGSADCAAVLRWAGVDDAEFAAQLGSDVPFCLKGGRARVTGVGEIVTPLDFVEGIFTLFVPLIHVSTPVVFAEWDAMGGPTGENGNDLEPAALSAYPELKKWRDLVGESTGQTPRLAGSGSTWFVEGALVNKTEGQFVVVAKTVEPLSAG